MPLTDCHACQQGFQFTEQSLWEASQASENAVPASPKFATYKEFQRELARRLLALLDSSKSMKPALSMAEQFGELSAEYFQTKEVLEKLVAAGQIQLAMQWAAQSGREMQVDFMLQTHVLMHALVSLPCHEAA